MSNQHTTHMGKNELVPEIKKFQGRGVFSKATLGAVVGFMMHGAAVASDLGKIDPRETKAYAALEEIFKGQNFAAAKDNKFVLDHVEPKREMSKPVVVVSKSNFKTPSGPTG